MLNPQTPPGVAQHQIHAASEVWTPENHER